MSAIAERVAALVEPLLRQESPGSSSSGSSDVQLYDVEYEGGVLRVVLDRPGGLDVGTLSTVTRAISAALDDADLIDASYTLEVSSPGIERRLRTPAHFAAALGEQIRVKVRPGVEGERRAQGELVAADDTEIVLRTPAGDDRHVRLDDITRANVHKDWTPPPKPGAPKGSGAKSGAAKASPKNEPTTRSETSP